jgi:hypothetical protein
MRKSQITSKEIKGDFEKYESYREAWSRIKQAQENDFFLEAITIQESIISDRLISFLSRPGICNSFSEEKGNTKFISFYKLIKHWRSEFPKGIQSGSYQDLIGAVDEWRDSRNAAIHAIVKSTPGEAVQPIDSFLQEAKKVAEEGGKLAREVCIWHKREKRK